MLFQICLTFQMGNTKADISKNVQAALFHTTKSIIPSITAFKSHLLLSISNSTGHDKLWNKNRMWFGVADVKPRVNTALGTKFENMQAQMRFKHYGKNDSTLNLS